MIVIGVCICDSSNVVELIRISDGPCGVVIIEIYDREWLNNEYWIDDVFGNVIFIEGNIGIDIISYEVFDIVVIFIIN